MPEAPGVRPGVAARVAGSVCSDGALREVLAGISFGYGSLIILSSLACFVVTWNSLMAPLILKERVSIGSEVLCSILLVTGTILIVTQNNDEAKSKGDADVMRDVWQALLSWYSITFVTLILAMDIIQEFASASLVQ